MSFQKMLKSSMPMNQALKNIIHALMGIHKKESVSMPMFQALVMAE